MTATELVTSVGCTSIWHVYILVS